MKFFSFFTLLFTSVSAFAVQSVSIESTISALFYLIVIGLIFYILWWGLGKIGLPEPFNKIAQVVIVLLVVVVLVNFLLGLTGHPVVLLR